MRLWAYPSLQPNNRVQLKVHVLDSIHVRTLATLAYTPGLPSWAHPSPKLVTPQSSQNPPLVRHTNGPPESPCVAQVEIDTRICIVRRAHVCLVKSTVL